LPLDTAATISSPPLPLNQPTTRAGKKQALKAVLKTVCTPAPIEDEIVSETETDIEEIPVATKRKSTEESVTTTAIDAHPRKKSMLSTKT